MNWNDPRPSRSGVEQEDDGADLDPIGARLLVYGCIVAGGAVAVTVGSP